MGSDAMRTEEQRNTKQCNGTSWVPGEVVCFVLSAEPARNPGYYEVEKL
jgi:hypothetical protein